MYSGSIEKTDFTEKDQKKGFLMYDSDNEELDGYGKCRFVEYKGCRPMLELSGTMIDMKTQFNKVNADKYQNAIIKFKFEGDRNESTAFSLGLRDFKKEIIEAISPIHMVHESKVKNVEMSEKVKEIQKEIAERDVGEGDVILLLREMIAERAENEDESKKLKSMMEEYYTRNRGQ
jgi:DNA repair exonuclease SbcCD nuclease subunit